ncbi:MAG: hypothetical protein AAGD00_08205 [Planctomycetota bacterium]
MSARLVWRWVAILMLIGVTGMIGFSVYRGMNAERSEEIVDDVMPTPDVAFETTTAEDTIRSDNVINLAALGGENVYTQVNPDDGTIEVSLSWSSLEPLPGGLFVLDDPRAWFYTRDRAVLVTAERGRVTWARSEDREPESGFLSGDVQIRVFRSEGRPTSIDDPKPSGNPDATIRTPSLDFQMALGELRTSERVEITAPGAFFAGSGLTLRFSETRRRLQFARIDQGERAWIESRDSTDGDQQTSSDRTGSSQDPQTDDLLQTVERYRLVIEDEVRIDHDRVRATAERLEAFAEFVGGALRDGAIAPLRFARTDSGGAGAAPAPTSGDTSDDSSPGRVELTWAGPLEIRPIRDRAPELDHDHAYVRLSSPRSKRVLVRDERSGATLRAVAIGYGLTSRAGSVQGLGGIGVRVELPDVGSAEFGRLDLDLASGIGDIPGPLTAVAAGDGPSARREVRSANGMSFRFRRDNDWPTTLSLVPASLTFRERVEARDGDARVSGDSIRVDFAPPNAGNGRVHPRSAIVAGNASGDDGRGGVVSGDEIRVAFEPDASDQVRPTLATASGAASAERNGDRIAGELLEVRLSDDPRGRVQADTLDARGDVRVTTTAGVEVLADHVRYDRANAFIDIIDEPAIVRYAIRRDRETTGAASLEADEIRLDLDTRTATVFGAGVASFERADDAPAESGYQRATLAWQDSMVFNDLGGFAEFLGDVHGDALFEGRELHKARARRVGVRFTPWSDGSSEERRVHTVTLEGDESLEGVDALAQIDLQRYAQVAEDGSTRDLKGLLALLGPEIAFDIPGETLTVPEPGSLVVQDRRDDANETSGNTLFTWDGGLELDAGTGVGVMHGTVRVRHRHIDAPQTTVLECEELTANLDLPRDRDGSTQPELRSVIADGAVFARHGDVQLVCDRLDYVAVDARLVASAIDANRVTVLDEAEGLHYSAGVVHVDLINGLWRVVDGTAVTIPR